MADGMLARDVVLPHARTRPRFGRRALFALAGLAALGGAAWFGADWWTRGRFIESTDDAYVGGDVTSIAPHVAGFVATVEVGDNQRVKQGQVLLRLDKRDFSVALDRARAALAEKEASVASLESELGLQQVLIRQAAAELRSRDARAAFAREDADRYASLATTSAGSRQEQQRASSVRGDAEASVIAGQAAVAAAVARVGVLERQLTGARAAADGGRASVRAAELDLGYTEIRSPIDGYVSNRAARVGAYAATGSYLLSVVPAQALWVDANFKEDQLAYIRPGQAVAIAADVAPGQKLQGHVASLSAGTGAIFSVIPPENATGNFTKIVQRVPVRVALDGGAAALGTLRPGLSITVSVDTREDAR